MSRCFRVSTQPEHQATGARMLLRLEPQLLESSLAPKREPRALAFPQTTPARESKPCEIDNHGQGVGSRNLRHREPWTCRLSHNPHAGLPVFIGVELRRRSSKWDGRLMKAPSALKRERSILSPSLSRVIAAFPLPVIIHDDQNQILQMSAGWTHFSGYTLDDVHDIEGWTKAAYGQERKWVKNYIDGL